MSKFVSNVWKNVKDAHRVTNDPRRWDELLEAPKRHYARSTSTTLGKIAMTALAAWGAGAALGAIGGSSGAAAGGGTGATASEGLIAGASTGAGTGTAGTVATASPAAGTIGQGAVMPNVAGEALTAGIQQGGASSAAGSGFGGAVKSGMSYLGNFAANNPELTAAAFQGVSSAMSPDEIDLMREQEDIRNERLARQNQNIEGVGGIDIGIGPGANQLRDQFGNPVFGPGSGLIQRNIGMKSPVRDKQGNRVDEEDEARVRSGTIQSSRYRSY